MLLKVKLLRKLGAVLLLLASIAAPAACVASDAGMTAATSACCRMMKNACGQMQMSGSQGCCTQAPVTPHDTALRADSVSLRSPLAVEAWAPSLDLFPCNDTASGWFQSLEHSPPKPPPSILSSLRV